MKMNKIAPCLNCGGEDIKFSNYEDTFGCISGGICRFCNNDISENWGVTKEDSIKIWNDHNSIDSLVSQEKDKIKKSKKTIEILKNKRQNTNFYDNINKRFVYLGDVYGYGKKKYTVTKKDDEYYLVDDTGYGDKLEIQFEVLSKFLKSALDVRIQFFGNEIFKQFYKKEKSFS